MTGGGGVRLLVLNTGSSTVKYDLFTLDPVTSSAEGLIERIGEDAPHLSQRAAAPDGVISHESRPVSAIDHEHALSLALDALRDAGALANPGDLVAVGHRVVHGGERFAGPALITAEVLDGIRDLHRLAPLHTGPSVVGIEAAMARCPGVTQVAVFDTSFHRTIPPHAAEYALPRAITREHGVRRYGFHGTSHAYVAGRAASFLGKRPGELNLITLHLGSGASVTAIRGGVSVDTSMGMTPLEGLMMGTRCGDVDPAVPLLLGELEGLDKRGIHDLLNHESGLRGVCGVSDMREVHRLAAEGDWDARLALEMFCYRARKYVGAYYAVLGRVDAIVFTAGIGEHDAEVRARICAGLSKLGIEVDEAANGVRTTQERDVSTQASEVRVLVIPTDEELEIARQALALVRARAEKNGQTEWAVREGGFRADE